MTQKAQKKNSEVSRPMINYGEKQKVVLRYFVLEGHPNAEGHPRVRK